MPMNMSTKPFFTVIDTSTMNTTNTNIHSSGRHRTPQP